MRNFWRRLENIFIPRRKIGKKLSIQKQELLITTMCLKVQLKQNDDHTNIICITLQIIWIYSLVWKGPLWSWLYGSYELQLAMQWVPITTNVVSSNPIHGEVYSIQHYVIKFVSDLRQVGGFLLALQFPPIKLTATV